MLLSRKAVIEYQRRVLDDHTWIKHESAEAMQAVLKTWKVRPYFKTQPWTHQLACFLLAMQRPDFLFLLDMGLGKTKILLDVMTHLQRERKLKRALVTVPRKVNIESWKDDIAQHSDLEPTFVDCEDNEEKWHKLSHPQGEISVIDYQALHLALSMKVKKGKSKRNVLVPDEKRVAIVQKLYNFTGIDESHKLTNEESLWFMLMRRMTAKTDFNYATTGTLFGRNVEDILPQFFLVDRGETFGENKAMFRETFMDGKANPWGRGQKWTPKPGILPKLNKMLQHRSIRYDSAEVPELDLPPRVNRIERFTMTQEQEYHYLNALNGLIQAGDSKIERENQWALMRRICAGHMKWHDDYGDHVVHFDENPKLDGLEGLIERALGSRSKAVVCYDYTETGRAISKRLESLGIDHEWFYGGTKDHAASRRRFMDVEACKVFVMNNESGSTGTDGLQKVARYQFFYETPTPPTTRKQAGKRIDRPGQTSRCFIYDLIMRNSLEPGILASLAANEDVYQAVVAGKAKVRGRGFFLQDLAYGAKVDI